MEIEERLKRFWVATPQSVREIVTVSLTHSSFGQAYHLWSEPYSGQVTLETSATVTVSPAGMVVKDSDSKDDLDKNYTLMLCLIDSQDLFRLELDKALATLDEAIVITFRSYLSDRLSAPSQVISLNVTKVAFNYEGAEISCSPPKYNLTGTGTLYTPLRFPHLRGFL